MNSVARAFLLLLAFLSVASCRAYQEALRQAEVQRAQREAHLAAQREARQKEIERRWGLLKRGMTEDEVYQLFPEFEDMLVFSAGTMSHLRKEGYEFTVRRDFGSVTFDTNGRLSSWTRNK